MSVIFHLEQEQWFPRPRSEIFEFFSDARNLDLLTPPWLDFRIVSPTPVAMKPGALIDYRIGWHGLPLRWRTEITVWEPPFRFVDIQKRGPYRQWIHEHTFEAVDGGTRMRDKIAYAVWGGALIHTLFVKKDVARIFDYRAEMMKRRFNSDGPAVASAAGRAG